MSKQKEFKAGDYVLFTPESNKERCEIVNVKGVFGDDYHVTFSDGTTWPVEKRLLKLFEISAGPWIEGRPTLAGFYNADFKIDSIGSKWNSFFDGDWSWLFAQTYADINFIAAVTKKTHHPLRKIRYRRQSPEYVAWLRARNLPVGEVHEE